MSDHGQAITGRDQVRALFIDRLTDAGLIAPKGFTLARLAEVHKRLVDYLAYMTADSLAVLADQVLQVPEGKGKNEWPSELAIRQMAGALEKRPPSFAPIVTSWLASIEGPRAEEGGYLVQLFRHLLRSPRPLLPYDLTQVKAQAIEDARRLERISDKEAAGVLPDIDRDWRDEYIRDLARARALVDRGREARAQGVAAE